ncbi:MAG: ubiquitin-specific protease ubp2 [Sclerophora amabilis]|nr:MAG: ubiquitin-specific protease ubp2 [Sclerophora amabilis]
MEAPPEDQSSIAPGPGLSKLESNQYEKKIRLIVELHPGKTAPRLIEDLYCYDPSHPPSNGYNVLAQPAPKYVEGRGIPAIVARDSCRHKYMLKHQQCKLPAANSNPGTNDRYKVASYCTECRTHLDLVLDLRTSRYGDRPCPTKEFPLHHFRYFPVKSRTRWKHQSAHAGQPWLEHLHFECSAPTCHATLTCSIIPARLTPDHIALLTDRDAIKQRVQREIDQYPDRLASYGIPEPVTVLNNLKTYLVDAKREPKSLKASNKKFLTSLGPGCSTLLNYLGFRYSEEDVGEGLEGFWALPKVKSSGTEPEYNGDPSKLVDDVEKELMLLICSRPWAEQTKARIQATFRPLPSTKEFERLLGCIDYGRVLGARRTVDLTSDEHPCCASLGARADFSDELLTFAFQRQRACHPVDAPYYLGCLQELASLRNSEKLGTEVAMMESAGEISSRDIDRAYQYFQISPLQTGLEDEFIIGTFKSRVADAPRHEAEARRHLQIIGVHRNSEVIEQVASNRISTYSQALAWLGAQHLTTDDFITSLVASKVEENQSDRALAQHAVSLIAEERDSEPLRNWLRTGELGQVEMDVGEAYTRLGIGDRTLEDDMILTTYQIRTSEAPLQVDELRAALQSIGKEKGSHKIASFLRADGFALDSVSTNWPVGLENIGNTCYLNSLLQFYFTVKPLRHILLNFSEYEMKITADIVRSKRVGSRKVSVKEIERAQKFAYELQKLFQTLITAPASAIAPERELARLTLIKSADEENFRRQSIASSYGPPPLGEINGAPILGPLGRPSAPMETDTDARDDASGEQVISDDTSDVTLVERPSSNSGDDATMLDASETFRHKDESRFSNSIEVDGETQSQQRRILEDKENNPPSKSDIIEHSPTTGRVQPLNESGESKTNEQGLPTQHVSPESHAPLTSGIVNGAPPTPPPEMSSPPDRPPPVPPRPKAAEIVTKPVDELEFGAQQDVTEVIGNVLFQLECAMRSVGTDSSGEQLDEIKQWKNHLRSVNASREIEEYFADIKVNVADGPRDIYAALDGFFDVQTVAQEEGVFSQYGSITQLPPILQIQVQRVQYDQQKKKSYKSNAHLSLRETIFMDRYMDVQDPTLLRKRQETWEWKEQLANLQMKRARLVQTHLNMSVPELMNHTREWLLLLDSSEDEDLGSPYGDMAEELQSEAARTQKELYDIEESIRRIEEDLEEQFDDFQSLPYRLQSVFIHRGTAQFGHYWIYIYDFDRRIWRKYNDEYVTEVTDVREVFEQDPHYPATPYCLVYVKDDLKDELVGPVLREVAPLVEDDPNSKGKGFEEQVNEGHQDCWASIEGTRPLTNRPGRPNTSDRWDSSSVQDPNGW